jgi:HK97 family phage major capsid protein
MTLAQMKDKKAEILRKAQTMLDAGQHTTPAYRSLITEAETLTEDITILESIERKGIRPVPVAAPIPVPTVITETTGTERARINSAYTTVLRHGNPPEEQRDLVTNVDAQGGSLVPQAFDTDWVEALKQASGIDQLVHRYGSGESFRPVKTVQVDTTNTNLAYVPEIGSTSTNALQTPALLSQIQNADNLVLRTTLSWQELDDAFDVLGWLKRSIAPIVSRGLSWAILTGTDPATSTALANSPAGGLTAFAPTGVTGASGSLATGPTYAELIALRSSVGSYAYQFTPKSGFVASEVTHNFLAAQLNSIGEPLYKRCPDTNLLMIAGSPLYVAQAGSMPAFNVASSKSVLFGAFDRAYAFVQTNPKFQVLQINPQQMTTDVIIRLRYASVGLYSNAASAFTTAAS